MNKNLVFVIFCFASCYSVKINDGPNGEVCTEDRAIEIAEDVLINVRKSKMDIYEEFNRILIESDSSYTIKFFFKDTLRRGGGLQLNILKENCKVVNIKRYQ